MQIKEQVPRGLRPGKKKSNAYHYWLQTEEPRKASRLPQLTKRNSRLSATNYTARLMEGSANPEGVS